MKTKTLGILHLVTFLSLIGTLLIGCRSRVYPQRASNLQPGIGQISAKPSKTEGQESLAVRDSQTAVDAARAEMLLQEFCPWQKGLEDAAKAQMLQEFKARQKGLENLERMEPLPRTKLLDDPWFGENPAKGLAESATSESIVPASTKSGMSILGLASSSIRRVNIEVIAVIG